MKSTTALKPQHIQRKWVEIDAADATLGRVSSRVARILMGKTKAYYLPHQDCGDYVVVVNAGKVKVSGNKEQEHTYYRHSGYPGALRTETISQVRAKDATKLIEKTVKGMLPKTKLGAAMIKKLYVYTSNEHPYKDKVAVLEQLN